MNARRLTSTTLAMLCALALGLLVWSAPALAVRGHVFASSLGSAGSGSGQLSEPTGVAVNETSGDVYVADSANNRVEYFTSAGAYEGQFNGSGNDVLVEGTAAPSGRFSFPEGIAIDNDSGSPSFGDVYVADVGHEVIDKFSATGAYLGQLTETTGGAALHTIEGLAVDTNGTLWVSASESENKAVYSFSGASTNEFIASVEPQFFAGSVPGLAVDSSDDLYVTGGFRGVFKLNSSGGVLIKDFDSLVAPLEPGEVESGVAVDRSNNEVYIADADREQSVGRFSPSGVAIETFGSGHITQSSGIAVNSQTGEVFVADRAGDDVEASILQPQSRPTIEGQSTSDVAASSATLQAQVNPTGPETTYHFQYGPTSCAASATACADLPAPPGVDIGGGFDGSSLSLHPQGLQPSTTYHFRVVASNELGTSTGSELTFTTQALGSEFTLPDGRAWELVTPPDKHGAGLDAVGNEQGADIQAAANGDAITYGSTSSLVANPAGSRSNEVTQSISARQVPGTWGTLDITTPHEEGVAELAVGHSAEYKLFSSDLSLGLIEPAGDTPLSPRLSAGETQEKTLYFRAASGEYKALITAANVPAGAQFGGNEEDAGAVKFVAATPDLSHVLLTSTVALTSTSTAGLSGSALYEWAGGRLQLVSVLPDEQATAAVLGETQYRVRHALSDDGSRLVFETPALYMRDLTSGKTVQLDAAQGAPEPPSAAARFQTASSDDSTVFFTSLSRLTAASTNSESGASGEDLYGYEVTSGASEGLRGKLTDLTVDTNAGVGADVRGVIGASEDGSSVYFVANAVLGDGAAHGVRRGDCERTAERSKQVCGLYVEHRNAATKAWDPPVFIATLSGEDAPSWGLGPENYDLASMTSRVSPDGRYLTFMSQRSLTGYENRDANSGVADEEVFLYDASTGRVVCTSCNPTGARPVGLFEGKAYEENLVDYAKVWANRWFAGNIPGWTTKDLLSALYQSRYLSDSGRLFFNSSDALVPADVNGKEDVYEYEPAGIGSCQPPSYAQSASVVFSETIGGCVALISSGSSSEESAFMDASEAGGDVFFLTLSRLSTLDFDTSTDLYDAHECLASSPCAASASLTPPACSTGDSCKAAPTPQPALFGAPASATFSGAGNVTKAPASRPAVKSKSKSLTRGQKLSRALKACKRKRKPQRAACERQARKRYGAKRQKSPAGKSLSARARR